MFPITHEGYTLSTNAADFDITFIHHFLSTQSHWAQGIPRAIVEKSIQHSLCFGLTHEGKQVGFARVITDTATFGYFSDVFMLQEHRGKGIMRWMIKEILSHPDLQNLRRLLLHSTYAQGFYAQAGFSHVRTPENWMEIYDPHPYQR